MAFKTVALIALSIQFCSAFGDEIRVMTSGAFSAAYLELVPQFESTTKNKIVTLATSMGTGPGSIPSRLQRGEPIDVVIVDDAALDALIKDGRVLSDSKVPLARSGIGMAVRAGTPKPDISSVEALKRTLLGAKSIAYSASVSGSHLSTELFPRPRDCRSGCGQSRRVELERVGASLPVERQRLASSRVSELLSIRGIDYVGPLPPEDPEGFCVLRGRRRRETSGCGWSINQILRVAGRGGVIAKSGLDPIAQHEALPFIFWRPRSTRFTPLCDPDVRRAGNLSIFTLSELPPTTSQAPV